MYTIVLKINLSVKNTMLTVHVCLEQNNGFMEKCMTQLTFEKPYWLPCRLNSYQREKGINK